MSGIRFSSICLRLVSGFWKLLLSRDLADEVFHRRQVIFQYRISLLKLGNPGVSFLQYQIQSLNRCQCHAIGIDRRDVAVSRRARNDSTLAVMAGTWSRMRKLASIASFGVKPAWRIETPSYASPSPTNMRSAQMNRYSP